MAMILSGSHLLLLDPSGKYLPDEWRRNARVLSLANVRRCVLVTFSKVTAVNFTFGL